MDDNTFLKKLQSLISSNEQLGLTLLSLLVNNNSRNNNPSSPENSTVKETNSHTNENTNTEALLKLVLEKLQNSPGHQQQQQQDSFEQLQHTSTTLLPKSNAPKANINKKKQPSSSIVDTSLPTFYRTNVSTLRTNHSTGSSLKKVALPVPLTTTTTNANNTGPSNSPIAQSPISQIYRQAIPSARTTSITSNTNAITNNNTHTLTNRLSTSPVPQTNTLKTRTRTINNDSTTNTDVTNNSNQRHFNFLDNNGRISTTLKVIDKEIYKKKSNTSSLLKSTDKVINTDFLPMTKSKEITEGTHSSSPLLPSTPTISDHLPNKNFSSKKTTLRTSGTNSTTVMGLNTDNTGIRGNIINIDSHIGNDDDTNNSTTLTSNTNNSDTNNYNTNTHNSIASNSGVTRNHNDFLFNADIFSTDSTLFTSTNQNTSPVNNSSVASNKNEGTRLSSTSNSTVTLASTISSSSSSSNSSSNKSNSNNTDLIALTTNSREKNNVNTNTNNIHNFKTNNTKSSKKLFTKVLDGVLKTFQNEEEYTLFIKRKKCVEASAKFRIRKKIKHKENLQKLTELSKQVNTLQSKILELVEDNKFWKEKLTYYNQLKSKELLESLKKQSIGE
ncbi:Met28p SCDLUD_005186 [Saccharomycodes ludwigii]|uniref:Met28p n=1 Tax=Saccharomycodes ludwigii TaxID=36035 RepID=UPI001E8C0778|nr:hypothetical protein SCDLUD_005186 [Saccharomycodes ludwigii]KAH3898847.1 hypothetical protein SCDLUD_005186 [Saccharomycodes ludwigii]